jgi:hypothetical protein
MCRCGRLGSQKGRSFCWMGERRRRRCGPAGPHGAHDDTRRPHLFRLECSPLYTHTHEIQNLWPHSARVKTNARSARLLLNCRKQTAPWARASVCSIRWMHFRGFRSQGRSLRVCVCVCDYVKRRWCSLLESRFETRALACVCYVVVQNWNFALLSAAWHIGLWRNEKCFVVLHDPETRWWYF